MLIEAIDMTHRPPLENDLMPGPPRPKRGMKKFGVRSQMKRGWYWVRWYRTGQDQDKAFHSAERQIGHQFGMVIKVKRLFR